MSKINKWYETFFVGLYGRVLDDVEKHGKSPQEAAMIKRLLRLRKGGSVLDCPCGMGRISLELAKLGLRVTGADLTKSYLAKARKRAKAKRLNMSFTQCDMRELPFENEFDAVVNWFTSFGYFDAAGDLAAAKAAFRALKPGGKFLIEMQNKTSLINRFTPGDRGEISGVEITSNRRLDKRASCICDVWVMKRGRKVERHPIRLRLYNGADMRAILRKAGFRNIRLFGRPPLGRLTRHSRRLIAIGQKPRK